MKAAGHRKLWLRIGAVGFSAALLLIIFSRLDLAVFVQTVRGVNPWGIVAAFALFCLGFLFVAWRWHLMLRLGGIVVHPAATLRSVLIGHCTYVIFFGAAGGDVVKAQIYARWYRLRMADVLAVAPLDRLMALIGAIAFGLLMAAFCVAMGGIEVLQWSSLRTPLLGVLALLAVAGLSGAGLLRWRPVRFQSINRFVASLSNAFSALLKNRSVFFKSAAAAFGMHACLSVAMAVTLAAVVQRELAWSTLMWTFPVISLIAGLPVTWGGAGTREVASIVFLGFFGVKPEEAAAVSMLILALNYCWCLVGLGLWWQGEKALAPLDSDSLPSTISVVIPTWNEAESLAATVKAARQALEVKEILLADGGSTDGTRGVGESLGCRVFQTARGRGTQMREAARHARNEIVLLLHADTLLSEADGRRLLHVFRDRRVVGGGFWKRFDRRSFWMSGSRFRCLIRLYLGRRVMGDQAMFVRRDVLERIGGVPDLPLFEEFELCRRLNRIGRLALADGTVVTSARRFRDRGVWLTYWLMWRITLGYYWGTPVKELAEKYRRR